MLDKVKLALRLTGVNAFDVELQMLIDSAAEDLKIAGVAIDDTIIASKPIIQNAIVLYCKGHFQDPDNRDKIMSAYNSIKIRLSCATGYSSRDNW